MATGPLFWALKAEVHTVTKPRKGREANPEPRPNHLDKLVLIILGDQATETDWSALLPPYFIAERAMCTERAVQEALARLEAAEFLRRRRVVLRENKADSWSRYYLLAPESPLVLGLLDVESWEKPEVIDKRQMDKHQALIRHRLYGTGENGGPNRPKPRPTKKRSNPGEPGSGGVGEPGSPLEDEPGSGGDRTRFTGVGEPGSPLANEPGSPLKDVSSSPLPPTPSSPPAEQITAVASGGEAGGDLDDKAEDPRVQAVVVRLLTLARNRRHRAVPSGTERGQLRAFLAAAFDAGWTEETLDREVLLPRLDTAKDLIRVWITRLNPTALGDLPVGGAVNQQVHTPSEVPAAPPSRLKSLPWCGQCRENSRTRTVKRRTGGQDVLPCDQCHPDGEHGRSVAESPAGMPAGPSTPPELVSAASGAIKAANGAA